LRQLTKRLANIESGSDAFSIN